MHMTTSKTLPQWGSPSTMTVNQRQRTEPVGTCIALVAWPCSFPRTAFEALGTLQICLPQAWGAWPTECTGLPNKSHFKLQSKYTCSSVVPVTSITLWTMVISSLEFTLAPLVPSIISAMRIWSAVAAWKSDRWERTMAAHGFAGNWQDLCQNPI